MSPQTKVKSVQAGVRDAMDFWLSQHDVSTPEIIQNAIRAAWKDWLDAHSQELIQAIAEATATHEDRAKEAWKAEMRKAAKEAK